MTDREKEIKQEWEKQLTQHFQAANKEITELLRDYLEYKQAEAEETNSDRRQLFQSIKADRAVAIVEFILSEKELMEKVKKFMESRKKY